VYVSDIFLRQLSQRGEELGIGTDASIDLFEKLPVPFGLVRYGVAPDHPAIKWIMGALEKTLDNPKIRLFSDVEFGTDITLADLRARYDFVIFTTGAVADRPLALPGSNLPQVYGAAQFVEWYDGYPTGTRTWPLEATQVAVIGGGNVAMDISRLLVKNPDDLLGTDIPSEVLNDLRTNKLQDLHLFVRRGPAQAKFSVQELRELENLHGVQIVVEPSEFDIDNATREVASQDKLTRQMIDELDTVRDMAVKMAEGAPTAPAAPVVPDATTGASSHEGSWNANESGDGETAAGSAADTSVAGAQAAASGVDFEGNPATRRYHIHFNANPVEILGEDGRVTGLRVERTMVSAEGKMVGTGEFTDYPVDAVYHAVGYKPAEVAEIPYDSQRLTLRNVHGRIVSEPGVEGREEGQYGQPIAGLYSSGWAKRGPVGLIGSTKSDAMETVSNILDDLAASPVKGRTAPEEGADAHSIVALLESRGVDFLDFAGWKRLDAYERAEGAKVNREHIKVVDPDLMRTVSRGE
jgi:ferredoxin--NADP+ reductase